MFPDSPDVSRYPSNAKLITGCDGLFAVEMNLDHFLALTGTTLFIL